VRGGPRRWGLTGVPRRTELNEAMLSLPSKPWKRVTVAPEGAGRYTVTVVSPVMDEEAFRQVIREDIEPSLGEDDRLEEVRWPTRSVTATVGRLDLFRRRLAFRSVIVERREKE
jgi:hypothetical protein